jgi:hypothetical protein
LAVLGVVVLAASGQAWAMGGAGGGLDTTIWSGMNHWGSGVRLLSFRHVEKISPARGHLDRNSYWEFGVHQRSELMPSAQLEGTVARNLVGLTHTEATTPSQTLPSTSAIAGVRSVEADRLLARQDRGERNVIFSGLKMQMLMGSRPWFNGVYTPRTEPASLPSEFSGGLEY